MADDSGGMALMFMALLAVGGGAFFLLSKKGSGGSDPSTERVFPPPAPQQQTTNIIYDVDIERRWWYHPHYHWWRDHGWLRYRPWFRDYDIHDYWRWLNKKYRRDDEIEDWLRNRWWKARKNRQGDRANHDGDWDDEKPWWKKAIDTTRWDPNAHKLDNDNWQYR